MVDNNSDDPFAQPEGTIMRPRPGAGRRAGASSIPRPAAPNTPQPGIQGGSGSATLITPSVAAAPMGTATGAELTDFITGSGNRILQCAAPLLLLASKLRASVQQASTTTLRHQAVQEIRSFEDRVREAGASREDALVSRYVLCTFLDTAVLNTPWGAQGDWGSQSLLVMFHKEVSGGQKFFEILERLRADPARHIDLIELLYVCLALGYEGKYGHDPNGRARLAQLQHEVFAIIRQQRALRSEDLSPHWKGVEDRRNPIVRYVPWWVLAAAGFAIVVILFIVLRASLGFRAEPIKVALATAVAPVNYHPAASPPHQTRLKELLANEEAAGRLTVEDLGDKAVVTLTAPNLFRSGSARVNPDLYPTLREIGQALEQVPGHIVVVGHTDDQPVHSLQYADNLDLSRARAVAVADVLKPLLTSFGRVEWQGVGSTQPRYPMDTPGNRARNRRVEIIHVPPPAVGSLR
jgi:type VI secretion system protein ImpK